MRGWRAGRLISALVVVAALVTLGLFALWPASTSTTLTHRSGAAGAPPVLISPAAAVAPSPPTTSPAFAPAAIGGETPLASESGAIGAGPELTTSAPAPSTSPSSDTGGGAGSTPPPNTPPPAVCPLPLSPATSSGGLQSLVGFAPAFGPFASEGFALAPAYAPLLQLFGPVISKLAAESPQGAPVLDRLLATLQTLSTSGYTTVAPFYGPYRTQFLTVETQIANTLAPYSEQLAGSQAGVCLVDLESAAVNSGG
ncbi:MAG TPA: hypothetical protein VFZ97_19905 [Acidimicrobiales bacterium]